MENKNKIGVVLSGGGVRGIAHLGVLQAFNEVDIYPDYLSGSSAGAIAAVMYAYGHKPADILDIIIQTNYFKFFRPSISFKALLKMDLLEGLFAKYLPIDNFSALKTPAFIAATNIQNSQTVFFSEGPLIKRLMASSCIPGMFEPILIEEGLFVDGGVLNNLPVEPLLDKCHTIIGINCNNLPILQNISHIKGLIERTVIMSMNYNVYSRKSMCDYFIDPPGLARYGVLEIKKAKEIYAAGLNAGRQFLEQNPQLSGLKNEDYHPTKQ
ncbi:patatin-like phospholipase family protein [Cyclobacterium plantarum]|uniref:Patatin-like phospholipase family protein n=1 Tax=Cyclobacterium plantarum TaxID=2716263 RepID=A0ABX0HAY0_9BACT|nr:patatin-like phospholipase family protein [Cyclobacterium plantarum]NHE57352.1 patatin-like phospholipase family protein [Cyclobacterium plantarum]